MKRLIVIPLAIVLLFVPVATSLAEQQPKAKPTGATSAGTAYESLIGVVESIGGGDPIRFTVRVLNASPNVKALERGGLLTVMLSPVAMRYIQEKKVTFNLKPGDRVKIRGFIQNGVFLVKRAYTSQGK